MSNQVKDMKAFEKFLDTKDDTSNVVGIGYHINDLRGIGTEYLVINGVITAKFYNGNILRGVAPVSGESQTLVGE